MSRLTRLCLLGVLGAAGLAGLGCGGSGSPTTPPPPPPPPPPSPGVFFTAGASPGGNTIYLAGPDSNDPSVFTLEVRASQVTDFYGLALDINFPNDLLSHKNNDSTIHEGTFLNADGNVTTSLLRDRQAGGLLVIGHTRQGEVEGVDGSGLLFSLDFTTDAAGTGKFTISRQQMRDSKLAIQEDVVWLAGTIEVRF
ncbi:MAG: cohesin domain-containing protein [Thermoanaerobaculia bacterium]